MAPTPASTDPVIWSKLGELAEVIKMPEQPVVGSTVDGGVTGCQPPAVSHTRSLPALAPQIVS